MWVFQGWSACTTSSPGRLPSCNMVAHNLGLGLNIWGRCWGRQKALRKEGQKDMWVYQGWSTCTTSGKGRLPSCFAHELGWSIGQNKLRKKETTCRVFQHWFPCISNMQKQVVNVHCTWFAVVCRAHPSSLALQEPQSLLHCNIPPAKTCKTAFHHALCMHNPGRMWDRQEEEEDDVPSCC